MPAPSAPQTAPHPFRVAVTWETLERLSPDVDESADLQPATPGARNSVGFKFTGFSAQLAAGGGAHRQAAISSFVVPVKLPATPPRDVDGSTLSVDFYGYKHILRGFIRKHRDARAVVTVNAAGSTKTVEFPFGVEIQSLDATRTQVDFEESFYAVQELTPAGSPPTYPAPPAYGADITISVERRHANAEVLLIIDELDVTASFASPDAPLASTGDGKGSTGTGA